MSPIGCSLLALACAALFVCACAEDLLENNSACRTLIIGETNSKYTNAVKLPERHLDGPVDKVTVQDVIHDHVGHWLVGIKYVACDFLTGSAPTITRDKNSALKVTISCDPKKPRCLAGLEMQATEYGILQLVKGPLA